MSSLTPLVSTLMRPRSSFHSLNAAVRVPRKSKSGISDTAFAQAWSLEMNETPTLTRMDVWSGRVGGQQFVKPRRYYRTFLENGPRFEGEHRPELFSKAWATLRYQVMTWNNSTHTEVELLQVRRLLNGGVAEEGAGLFWGALKHTKVSTD